MGDRLLVGRYLDCAISCVLPVVDGLSRHRGKGVVPRQKLGLALANIELLVENGCDASVQLLPSFAEQGVVSNILHEGMLEQIMRVRRQALPKQQAGLDKTIERERQLGLGPLRDGCEQSMRKFPSDCRSDLRHLLGL